MIDTILEGKYKINSLIDQNVLGGLYLAQNIKKKKDVLINFLHCGVNTCIQSLFFDKYYVEPETYPQPPPSKKYPGVFITNIGATKDDKVYLILEYVDYPSLMQEVARKMQFSPLEAVTIGLQLSNIMARLNSLGVIYRYINPDTIMVDLNDKYIETKALDFDIDNDKLYNSQEFTQIYNTLGIKYDPTPIVPPNTCQCGFTLPSTCIFCPSCGKRPIDRYDHLKLVAASAEFMTPEFCQGAKEFHPMRIKLRKKQE